MPSASQPHRAPHSGLSKSGSSSTSTNHAALQEGSDRSTPGSNDDTQYHRRPSTSDTKAHSNSSSERSQRHQSVDSNELCCHCLDSQNKADIDGRTSRSVKQGTASSNESLTKITFRLVRSIEDEYSYAPSKKDAIIGKGAYSVVYRAIRRRTDYVSEREGETPNIPPTGLVVALKVISKVPEGFSLHSSSMTVVPSGAEAEGKDVKARSEYDDRRDDTHRELEVLNRLRSDNCTMRTDDKTLNRPSDYNGCLQMIDALETETHWCLVTTYDPMALDLGTYFKKRQTAERKPSSTSSLESGLPSGVTAASAISEQHAALIILQLLCIVRKLHENQRLVHRDLKPENILIAPVERFQQTVHQLGAASIPMSNSSELLLNFESVTPLGDSPQNDENKRSSRAAPPTEQQQSDENKKRGQKTSASGSSLNSQVNVSSEIFDGALVTLLDFGFSRFLHTDAVLVRSNCCDNHPTVVSPNNDNDRKPSDAELTVTPFTEATGSNSANQVPHNNFSTLVESPVIPKTPLLFPAPLPPPNSGGSMRRSRSVEETLAQEQNISHANHRDVVMGCPMCTSTNKPPGSKQHYPSHEPAPLLLLTACGTDKYLPYEVLLWAMKRAFYPSPPAGLPPTHNLLSARQPHLRPTTIEHAKALDSYALGVICHILLSGRVPFDGANKTALYLQQHNLQSSPAKALLVQQVVGTTSSSTTTTASPAIKPEEGINALESPSWKLVSDEAKTMVRGLLHVNPDKRWSIDRALQCGWMQDTALPTAHAVLPAEMLGCLLLPLK